MHAIAVWLMLIMWSPSANGNAAAVDHIFFNTRGDCEAVRAEIKNNTGAGTLIALCIKTSD